jgi:Protein of unknown function (DUF4230)
MLKRISLPLVLAAVFALGGFAGWQFFSKKSVPQQSAQIMLERVKKVCKLVTVEGQYSEVFSHSEYEGFFTYFWDKKMLLRVNATVSAGFDLEKVKFEADSSAKVIRIGPLPAPDILSIDHTVDYYDISEGLFTNFTPSEYTQINQKVKEVIREEARQKLLPSAQAQARETFDIVRAMVAGMGWTVEIVGEEGTLR